MIIFLGVNNVWDVNKESRAPQLSVFWLYVLEILSVIGVSVFFISTMLMFYLFDPSKTVLKDIFNIVIYCLNFFIQTSVSFPEFMVVCIANSFTFLLNWVIFGPLVLLVWTLLLSYFNVDRFQYLKLLFFPFMYYVFGFCCLFYIQSTFNFINYLLDLQHFYLEAAQVTMNNPTNAFPQFYFLSFIQDYIVNNGLVMMNTQVFVDTPLYVFDSPRLSSYFMCCADLFGLLFVGLTILIISLCLFILSSLVFVEKYFKLYVSLLLSILFLLNLVFLTPNLVIFFIAFESLLIPIIFLISIWGSPNKRQATNYLIFYTSIGAIPMIVAILYLRQKVLFFYNVNVITLSLLNFSWTEQQWLFLALFFSFAIKTPIVPVHIWLPKAHVDAPTTGSVILAGLLLKIGLFGFIRFLFPVFPLATIFFSPFIAIFASIGVLYASLITLWQIDIKRIIAYSSVAHMNIALVSLCTLTKVGSIAAVFIMLSHGLISSALFFLVGFLYNRFHQRTVFYYGGLATVMPVFTIFFFFFSLANIAFPLTSGFISEFLCLLSIININYFLGIINALSMLLTTGYSILLFGRLCLDNPKPWLLDLIHHDVLCPKVTTSQYDITIFDSEEDFAKLSIFDLLSVEFIILLTLSCFVCFFGIVPVDLLVIIDDNLDMSVLEDLLKSVRLHLI